MRVIWLRAALIELAETYQFIAQNDPDAARRVHEAIREAAASLAQMPHRSQPGRWPGTRELVLSTYPYVIPYRVRGDALEILRVLHTSRRPPKKL